MTKTVEVRNDFHDTKAMVRMGRLSPRTVRRIRKALCGMADCHCGGNLSERGPQEYNEFVPDYNGGGVLE